jgi:ankyrin repeat protein
VSYLCEQGVEIDVKGGELMGTPLQWAVRCVHTPTLVVANNCAGGRGLPPQCPPHVPVPLTQRSMSVAAVQRVVDLGFLRRTASLLLAVNTHTHILTHIRTITLLHHHNSYGHMETVVAIVNQGADPNVTDNQTFNSLHLAAQFGFPYICAYLVAKGVNVDSGDSEGQCRYLPVFVLLLPSLPPHHNLHPRMDMGAFCQNRFVYCL